MKDAFTEFCEENHCAESVYFLIGQEALRNLEGKRRDALAQTMLEALTVKGGELELNLDSPIRKQVTVALRAITRTEAPQNLNSVLDAACTQIIALLQQNQYPTFQKL